MSDVSNQTSGFDKGLEDISIMLPPEKDVVFYNDDYTTMEFVVDVLISVFNIPRDRAEVIMQTVHAQGSAVVGTYTYDIAVSRVNITRAAAKKQGFPLRVEVE